MNLSRFDGIRILLVEDNELNRDMLKRRLTRRGFEVSTAVTGRECIQSATEQVPDLILMDMNLPEVDGWVATRTLRAIKQTANVPIIALTAHAMPGDRERTLEAGCNDYEPKPIEFQSLIEKIQRLVKPLQEPDSGF